MSAAPNMTEAIAKHYGEAIRSGSIEPGESLPPHSEIAEQFGTSLGTARNALTRLKESGMVERGNRGMVASWSGESIGWKEIHEGAKALHESIEASFAPDVVLTMSGPGSFVPFLTLALNDRLTPVVAAVTFPARDGKSTAEAMYAKAARGSTGATLETDKWRVYLPKSLDRYPEGSKVLILDDRVVSGTTQALARDRLTGIGHVVQTAALVASTENAAKVDHVALIIDDDYRLPWGSRRGRT